MYPEIVDQKTRIEIARLSLQEYAKTVKPLDLRTVALESLINRSKGGASWTVTRS